MVIDKNGPYKNKYWENEKGEVVVLGNDKFLRCFDQAGKLQFGTIYKDGRTGEDAYAIKFVIDRKTLFANNGNAASYLRVMIDDWEEMLEHEHSDGGDDHDD